MLAYIRQLLGKVSIHVVRNYRNTVRDSRPCQACMDFLKYAGVKNVYYSDNEGRMVRCRVSRLSGGIICSGLRAQLKAKHQA